MNSESCVFINLDLSRTIQRGVSTLSWWADAVTVMVNSTFFYNLGDLWGFLRQGEMNSGFGGEKVLDQKIYHVILLVELLLAVAAR